MPKAVPTSRVLLFGYNSSVSVNAAAATLRTHAAGLLERLRIARTDEVSHRFRSKDFMATS